MSQLKIIVENEIFNNSKKRKRIVKSLGLLFSSLNDNKEVLTFVQDHFESNVLNNKKFTTLEKSRISNLLKKTWLKTWLTKKIELSDIKTIKKYFNSYTSIQQNKIYQKINSLNLEIFEFKVKPQNVLTEALKNYRYGKPELLRKYVSNQEDFKYVESNRIIKLMRRNFLNNTLPIFTETLNKSKDKFNYIEIDQIRLLSQPLDDNKNFISSFTEKVKELTVANKNDKYLNEKLIESLTGIDISDKEIFLMTVGDFFISLSYFNLEKIEQILRNTNEILSPNKYFKKWIKIKLKIESNGVEAVIDSLKTIMKEYEKLSYSLNLDDDLTAEEFEGLVKNVTIVYKNYKMNELFKNKENSLETQNKRIKI